MSKPLLLIFACYLALSLVYLALVPVGEAPDEPAHFLYARHLADTGNPPPPAPPQRDSFWKNGYVTSHYEWHQPPLYYALGGLLLRAGRSLGLAQPYTAFPPINPDFPGPAQPLFVPVPLAFTEVHLLRLFSTLLGGLSLWATAALARRLFPGERYLPELAAGFLACLPQFTFLHAYATNDAPAIAASGLGLLALIRAATGDPHTARREWLWAGGAVALALAVKMTAWYLLPLGLLLLAVQSLTPARGFAATVGHGLHFAGVAALGLLFSRLLWSDFFVRIFHSPHASGIKDSLLSLDHWGAILPITLASFWGTFGWMNLPLTAPLLRLLDGLLLLGLVGALVWYGQNRRRLTRGQNTGLLLLCAGIGAVIAGFVYFNLAVVQPQGRLLFTALPAVALFFALGWKQWLGRWGGAGVALLLGLLLAVNLAGLYTVLLPAYGYLAG